MKIVRAAAAIVLVASSVSAAGVVKRGAAVPSTKATPLKTVLASPAAFSEKPVVVEGVIEKSCTAMGCWMELAPEKGQAAVRVTFKNESFFIPLTAKGMNVRAEGVTEVKKLSKDEADHLAGEGATLVRNADGTADEVSFVATGVELTQP